MAESALSDWQFVENISPNGRIPAMSADGHGLSHQSLGGI